MTYKENETGRRYPLRVLMWECTLRCNAFCEFCGSSCNESAAADELSSAEIRGLFRRISEQYDASNIMINVTGGEPLLRRDLFDVMEYAVSLGYKWGIVTNGSLLSDANIEGLKRSRVSTISVSLDGMREIHDQIRRFPGCFDRTVCGLKKLEKLDTLEHCMVTTIISGHNFDQLEPLKQFLCSLPVDIWRIGIVDPIGRAHENAALLPGPEEVQGVLSFIRSSRKETLPYRITTTCSHYLGEFELTTRDAPFQCFSGKQLAGILANGDIFVCPNVPRRPELIQGNIRTDDFIEVWENGFKYFRDPSSRKKNRCAACSHFPVCAGDSLHTWDFDRQKPQVCFLDYGLQPQKSLYPTIREKSFNEIIDACRTGKEKCRCLRVKAQSMAKDRVILSPAAVAAVFSFFCWGGKRNDPAVEQIACLTGEIFLERRTEETFLVYIQDICELHPLYADDITIAADDGLIREARQAAAEREMTLVGFIHSHPGSLGIGMSLGDYEWHKQIYSYDRRAALNIIINPDRMQIAAYTGPAANHTELVMVLPKDVTKRS